MVRHALVVCVMALAIHLGAWSMAMLHMNLENYLRCFQVRFKKSGSS